MFYELLDTMSKSKKGFRSMNTFICYERCTTCKKAQKWLDTKGVEYKVRPIKEAEWEETVL